MERLTSNKTGPIKHTGAIKKGRFSIRQVKNNTSTKSKKTTIANNTSTKTPKSRTKKTTTATTKKASSLTKTKKKPLLPKPFEIKGHKSDLFKNYQLYNLLTYIYRDFTDNNYERFNEHKDEYLKKEFEEINKKYEQHFRILIEVLDKLRQNRIDNYFKKGQTSLNNLNNSEITSNEIITGLTDYYNNHVERNENNIELNGIIEQIKSDIIPPN